MTEPLQSVQPRFQGSIRKGARLLIDSWKQRFAQAREDGSKVIWSFVMANHPYELVESFDMPVVQVLPEFNSMRTCLKRSNETYLDRAEELGYSSDVCGYLKIEEGIASFDLDHPDLGKIPQPDLIICPTVCNTYLKWAEMWRDRYEKPVIVLDVPLRYMNSREEYLTSDTFKQDRRYVMDQLRELIAILEKMSGNKFNPDRLAERQAEWNQLATMWSDIMDLNKRKPAPFDIFEDAFNLLAGPQTFRGAAATKDVLAYMEVAKLELEERIALGMTAVPSEKFRFILYWAPVLFDMRRYLDLFRSKGGVVFVHSLYVAMHDPGFRYDVSRPLESAAESLLFANMPEAISCFWNRAPNLLQSLRDYSADALVLQGAKGCRTISTPLLQLKEQAQEAGVPTLFLDGDIFEIKYFSEAAAKNRVDAFFERLESDRIRLQRGA